LTPLLPPLPLCFTLGENTRITNLPTMIKLENLEFIFAIGGAELRWEGDEMQNQIKYKKENFFYIYP